MTATRSVDDEAAPGVAMEERGDIGIVGFDRADGFNSFDKATRIAFRDSLLKLEKNDAIRAVVIHGNDRGFNVGADLNEFLREKISGAEIKRQLHEEYFPAYQAIGRMGKPVIAAVRGPAAGIGMSLALQCDLMVMGENAYLMSPFANLSLCPDGGANWILPARLGYRQALEFAIECQKLNAGRCLGVGLANKVVPDDEVISTAVEWASHLAKRAPLAIRSTKLAMRQAQSLSYDEMFMLEASTQEANIDSEDFQEGLDAFLNKRVPVFKGK